MTSPITTAQLAASAQRPSRIVPSLDGVPETMLWTLYSRATEPERGGALLRDPEGVRIWSAIDYDFVGRFGPPDPLYALRAALIDAVLRRWLRRHPDGLVVSLGEGLETQFHRVDNGLVGWLTVDLPEAIRLRELFIQPGGRLRHFACSATDHAWMDEARPAAAVFIVMQGLLMYLQPQEVRRLLLAVAARFRGAELMFDTIDGELSRKTLRGHQHSATYVWPPMPWGLDRNEVLPTLREWNLNARAMRLLRYRIRHRRPEFIDKLFDGILPKRQRSSSLVHVKL